MSNLLDPIDERDQWRVTAYLIALTPDLQQASSTSARPPKQASTSASEIEQTIPQTVLAKPASYNPGKAEELFIDKCTQCHKLSKVENYDFATSGDVEQENGVKYRFGKLVKLSWVCREGEQWIQARASLPFLLSTFHLHTVCLDQRYFESL